MAIREIFHDPETIQRYRQAGAWSDTTLDDALQEHARVRGDKVAIVDRAWRLTFAELDRLALRVACGLVRLGLTSGDVVSIQTPNWAEWLVMHCALEPGRYVSVVGRKKDMIIRGGANISAREIEEILFIHPKVANVACVAMPDPVMAERVCAFVVCRSGEPLTFGEMIDFLKGQRMSVWKLPERLELRDAFPMTPSGKIQKYLLRDEIARLLDQTALIR